MTYRDLLLEFIQWLVDNPGIREPIFDAPEDELAGDIEAVIAVDDFLEAMGEPA